MAHPAHVLRPADHLSFPGTTSLLFLPSITNLTRSFPVFMSPFIPAPSISYIYMFPHTRNHLRNTVNAFRLLLKYRFSPSTEARWWISSNSVCGGTTTGRPWWPCLRTFWPASPQWTSPFLQRESSSKPTKQSYPRARHTSRSVRVI